jgi:hypothetical protein
MISRHCECGHVVSVLEDLTRYIFLYRYASPDDIEKARRSRSCFDSEVENALNVADLQREQSPEGYARVSQE